MLILWDYGINLWQHGGILSKYFYCFRCQNTDNKTAYKLLKRISVEFCAIIGRLNCKYYNYMVAYCFVTKRITVQ